MAAPRAYTPDAARTQSEAEMIARLRSPSARERSPVAAPSGDEGVLAGLRAQSAPQWEGAAGMGLDNRDFTEAAGELVTDLLDSGRLDRPNGGRYVMAISRFRNSQDLRQVLGGTQRRQRVG